MTPSREGPPCLRINFLSCALARLEYRGASRARPQKAYILWLWLTVFSSHIKSSKLGLFPLRMMCDTT